MQKNDQLFLRLAAWLLLCWAFLPLFLWTFCLIALAYLLSLAFLVGKSQTQERKAHLKHSFYLVTLALMIQISLGTCLHVQAQREIQRLEKP